jgi:DNA-binding SARP family transcriptional activator
MAREIADTLVIHCFGPFRVQVGGAPLPRLRSRKAAWLLALLLLRHGREAEGPPPVERGWLATTLWPECPEVAGALQSPP